MISFDKMKKKDDGAEKEIDPKKIDEIIDDVREKLIEKYNNQVLIYIGKPDASAFLKPYISTILAEFHTGFNNENVINKLYDDIFGFSIIEPYLNREDVEEINGNAWDDIEVVTQTESFKIQEHFSSPEHAINILKKMALLGKATLDEAFPIQDSYIGTGLRLTAMIAPIVDDDIGVSFSLRILKDREISRDDLIYKYHSYSEEEMEMIEMFAEHGVSMIFGGATSSGKSSDIQTIYSEIAQRGEKRIYVIEERARELNLIHKDDDGKTISRVIHTRTRPSSSKNALDANSDMLVKTALRYNPDIIITAETRGSEALASVEAALTGHAVITSAHIKSVTAAYKRMLRLCKKADPGSTEDMLMSDIVNAYPIVIFKKQLEEDNSRRCIKIFEATGYDSIQKKIIGRILRTFIKTFDAEGNVVGEHRIVNKISNRLSQILYEQGCSIEKIKRFNDAFNPEAEEDYVEEYLIEV